MDSKILKAYLSYVIIRQEVIGYEGKKKKEEEKKKKGGGEGGGMVLGGGGEKKPGKLLSIR